MFLVENQNRCFLINFQFLGFSMGEFCKWHLGSQALQLAVNLDFGIMINENTHQRDNCINEKYCYNDQAVNCGNKTYYQWDELMRYDDTPVKQGFCPPGWHVPSDAEWNTLFANWAGSGFAASPLKYSGFSGFNALLSGVDTRMHSGILRILLRSSGHRRHKVHSKPGRMA